LPFWDRKKQKKGPFDANRILDTDQVKIDQVFTHDGKPIALFTSVSEDQSRKMGAEGYIEGTTFSPKGGVKGTYESERKWKTYPLFWKHNIPEAVPLDRAYPEIRDAVKTGSGTLLPESVPFHDVAHVNSVQISDNAQIKVEEGGQTTLSGDVAIGRWKKIRLDDQGRIRLDTTK